VIFWAYRFNGAAFFQSGKWGAGARLSWKFLSFNGAAFFQSGKCQRQRLHFSLDSIASMEPLFFKAENRRSSTIAGVTPAGFNGAAFFQSGK